MRKSRVPIISFLIFLLVYVVVILLVPFVRNKIFWCTFVITIIEYCFISAIVIRAINTNKEKIFELAKIRYSCVFFLMCTVINLVVMVNGKLPIWGVIIPNVITIGVYAVAIMIFSELKNKDDNFEKGLHERTREFKVYSLKIEQFLLKACGFELRKSLNEILEVLKYSDPVTLEQLFDLNSNINRCIDKLEELIHLEKEAEAIECSNNLLALLQERNRLCKLHK